MPVLLLSVFLDLAGFGLILPLLPFYAQHFGASALQVLLLSSTFSLAQMLSALLWGGLSDRFGRRPVLLCCLGLSVASYVGFGLASSFPALIAARALSGFASGKISIAEAWVADVTPPERRTWGMGLIGAAMGIGYVVGPAAGGLLAGDGPVVTHWQTPALAAAGLSLAAFLLALLTLKEPLLVKQRRGWPEAMRQPAVSSLLAMQPGFVALLVIHFIVSFVFTLVEALFPLWAEDRLGWGALQVGMAFAAIGMIIAATQAGLVGPLSRRFGDASLMLAGMAAVMLSLTAIPIVTGMGLLVVTLSMLSVGIAAVLPSMTSLISKIAPGSEQGAVLGLANTAAGTGRILGPAWAGWVLEGFSHDTLYLSSGALMLGALLLLARSRPAVRRAS
jgi:MFS family permease